MRLGGMIFRPATIDDLDRLVEPFDVYGLSAVSAPAQFIDMTDGEAVAFGERARELGMVIGEGFARPNLMVRDDDLRADRIANLRTGLAKAELMGAHAVVILVGTVGPEDHLAAPHSFMYTDECKKEFREILLRALDGLDLPHVKLVIEPWTTSFFYQPADIREFLDGVGHPAVALHLDIMNMVDQYHYFRTADLINSAFDLLTPYIAGVHFKDLRWDWMHMLMKFDEVPVGEGVIDYPTYLRRLAQLETEGMFGTELTCFCEHFPTEGDYAVSFARLHHIAEEVGLTFRRRSPGPTGR